MIPLGSFFHYLKKYSDITNKCNDGNHCKFHCYNCEQNRREVGGELAIFCGVFPTECDL